jgi:hypothetical protein
MKSKKSTAKKNNINSLSGSAGSSQKKDPNLNPENIYIDDNLEGINKMMSFYTQIFSNFLELSSEFAAINKKLQEEYFEYTVDAHINNSNATNKMSISKSLPEIIHTHSDLIQSHVNNNVKHLINLSKFSTELGDKIIKDISNGVDEINKKIKDSCHLYRAEKDK